MKMLRTFLAATLLLVGAPAFAQWQTPNHSVPVGKGSGFQGFSAAVPGTAGQPLVSTGSTTDPAFGNIANSGFAAGAAGTVKGSLNGSNVVDIPVPPCTAVNQAIQWTAGSGPGCGNILTLTGYDMPINAGISSSAVAGALTINLTTASGSAPTAGAPVLIPFRSTTGTLGTVTWNTVTAATSITIPSTATLGTSNGVPFRVWVFAAHNGGATQLGVATCSNTTSVFPCSAWETTLETTTTISAGATSGGVLYTQSGVTLDAVRIIGYCDFASGLATAGMWSSACTGLQPFGPGVKKPGDVVQTVTVTTSTPVTTTAGPIATNLATTITPTATANPIKIFASGEVNVTGTNANLTTQVKRNTSVNVSNFSRVSWASATAVASGYSGQGVMFGFDSPGSVSSQAYAVYLTTTGGTAAFPESGVQAIMILDEIMGALGEPANDNINPGIFSQTG